MAAVQGDGRTPLGRRDRHGSVHVGRSAALRLGPEPGGTRVRWEERLRFPWWFGGAVGATVAAPVLRAVWRKNLVNLKAKVEG